ncbi:MAG TPA: type II toxin-antitoxin system VapC family toxin [Thermoanaerobaculia bacterium]|jgi:PIN domain nuclease of toxin-antitoxin system|nr:type II toxin-antitoxin system VapC family toxin [Thermoanaerobaculia bacterium]
MRFLIDTHCWLWAVRNPERLLPSAAKLIESAENTVVLSAVSALEIAIKASLGKLELSEPAAEFVSSQMVVLSMTSLPVYLTHALRVGLLPHHHRDPFDRLLVAQSQIERLPLMTADAEVAAYDVEVIWAGRGRRPRNAQ